MLLRGQASGKVQTKTKISFCAPRHFPQQEGSSENHCVPSSKCPSDFSRFSSLFYG